MSPTVQSADTTNDIKSHSHWPVSILATTATFISTVLPLFLARILSPHDMGVFRIFFLYLTTFPAFCFTQGFMSGLAYWSGQKQSSKAIQLSGLAILLIGLSVSILLILGLPFVSKFTGWEKTICVLFAIAILHEIAGGFFSEAAIVTGKTWMGAIFFSGFEVLRSISMVTVAIIWPGYFSIIYAYTIFALIKLITGYFLAYKLNLVSLSVPKYEYKKIFSYALPVSVAVLLVSIMGRADQLLLSRIITESDFALYSIGCLSLAPLFTIEQSVTRVAIPQLASLFALGNAKGAASLYRNTVKELSFFFIPAAVGLATFSEPIIYILFGSKYLESYHYLRFYSLTYLLLSIPYDASARARGDSKWILKTLIIFTLFSVICATILASYFGTWGALSSYLISMSLLRLYSIYSNKKNTGWTLKESLPLGDLFFRSIICSILSVISILSKNYFSSSIIWFFVLGSFFTICYLLSVVIFENKKLRKRIDKINVLVVTQGVAIGGLERLILQLCISFQKIPNYTLKVFAYNHGAKMATNSLLPQFIENNIPVEVFKKSGGFSFKVLFLLLKNVLKNDIHILHTQDIGGLIYASIIKLITLNRVKIIQTQHSFIHLEKNSRYVLYEKIFSRFADIITAVSEEVKNKYIELGIKNNKVYFLKNGVVFPDSARPIRAIRKEKRYELFSYSDLPEGLNKYYDKIWVIYLARIYPKKGQEHALRAWTKLPKDVREKSALIFVGPTEENPKEAKRLKSLAEKSPDADKIFFIYGTSNPTMWYQLSDIYISTSESEGMPLGPLEAIGAGVPTILSNIHGHEFLKDYTLQFSYQDDNKGSELLSSIIKQIDENDEVFDRQIWHNTEKLREQFSIQRVAEKYAELYSNLVTRGRK